MDEKLRAVAAAAEAGQVCAGVNLLMASWLLQGTPASTEQFMRTTHDNLYAQIANSRDARKFRGDAQQLRDVILEQAHPLMIPFGDFSSSDDVLNLLNVTIVGSIGPSLHVPAVRVPLAQIMGWWATDFEVKQGNAGGGFGVGVSF